MKMARTKIAIAGFGVLLIVCLPELSTGRVGGEGSPQNSSSQEEGTIPAHNVYEGMITCSRCGAKHAPDMHQTADTCVRVCVHGGAKFALVNADSSYVLEGDLSALKKLSGQRARVMGTLNGKTIRVYSATAD